MSGGMGTRRCTRRRIWSMGRCRTTRRCSAVSCVWVSTRWRSRLRNHVRACEVCRSQVHGRGGTKQYCHGVTQSCIGTVVGYHHRSICLVVSSCRGIASVCASALSPIAREPQWRTSEYGHSVSIRCSSSIGAVTWMEVVASWGLLGACLRGSQSEVRMAPKSVDAVRVERLAKCPGTCKRRDGYRRHCRRLHVNVVSDGIGLGELGVGSVKRAPTKWGRVRHP